MANLQRLRELAPYSARRTSPKAEFSVQSVRAAFSDELKELTKSINSWNKNKYDFFEIVMNEADEIVPAKVVQHIGAFANVHNVPLLQKVVLKHKRGRTRAKQFVTRAAVMGVYRTFRLDSDTSEINTYSIGAGVSIDFQRMLENSDDLGDLIDVITETMVEYTYLEIQKALRAAYSVQVPSANRVSGNAFDPEGMLKLVRVASSYAGGTPAANRAVIFAPPEFIGAMGADAIVPAVSGAQGIYHPDDIDSIHKTGTIKLFRGTPIVEIPQSFIDENNVETWIDPQLAYVLPTGGQKVVDVVFEGGLQVWDHVNRDQSIEIMYNKLMGVSISTYHNWGIFRNTGITQTMAGA